MKNKTLVSVRLFIAILGLTSLYSCKKDYACVCTQVVTVPGYTYDGQNYQGSTNISTVTNSFKSKKKDAEAGCKMGESFNSYPSPYAAQGQGQTTEIVTCELK